jgi:AcrR family transcriptional regulator
MGRARTQEPAAGRDGRRTETGDETRTRILDVAERRFADRGFDGVSIRDITREAGVNGAAIHYHFGTKQDLVAAIVRRRSDALRKMRAEVLDLAGDGDNEVRTIAEALVRPAAELVASGEGGRSYVAFLAAIGSHPSFAPILTDLFDPFTDRFTTMLARALPTVPEDVLVLRVAIAKDLVLRVIGQPDGNVGRWLHEVTPTVSHEDVVESVIDLLVGALGAPVTERASLPRSRTTG